MAGNDWLGTRRNEVAADRILDAAGDLFAERSPGSVGMHEIAAAAGCSRATLYRYFENRDALHTAYVHREAHHLYARMTECIAEVADPRERLIAGFLTSLELVRQSPALSSWFAASASPIGVEIAESSEVIQAMGSAFIVSLGADDPAAVQRKARWLVRVLTSLLLLPGRDAADERAMVEEFLVPIMAPGHTVSRNSSPG
ncbi:putative HTH-type transcriptional regulator [Mycolicibacterium murale]|uniref:Putative HTH-type transcriptional regulator n=1 Tax=Mycolicibacterium murale TaxID=182220 RepID=A0A7I9WJG1_9MYCO|nr:TetR/AcrR family transcriptional regulator [Mycolicibacterium murale]MCV7184129.1 TetR/AcrR family transcriptional regulator [Mycolicibacterium murale]GFG57882.1 putative HTH-type transcriptional regulator [Mycolicibacterium murale]